MINLNAWFQKHDLCAENILYIYRKDRKTVIQRTDGAEFALFVPVHSILSTLPEKNFLSISKGIVVCRSHRRLSAEIGLTNTKHRPLSMLEKCSLLDNMPLAFCVIELVFNEDGHGVDFIFRYCNAEMANVEGVPVEEMLNRSFYKVFPNGDKKWLVSYADIALNGTKHTLHDYSPEIGKNLIIHCYQPEPGYCACVLQVADQ